MEKILVVEDNNSMRIEICDILKMENFEVFDTADGLLALEIAKQKLPNLIISDIMMPILDGYQLHEELIKEPLTQDIPFIFISALADKEYIRKGMNMGADDYLTKPVSAENLVETVKRIIEKSQKYHNQINALRKNVGYFLPFEMRTPLNRIIAFSEYLLNELNIIAKSEILKVLQFILKNEKHLEPITEDSLVLSKLFNQQINSNFLINLSSFPPIDTKKSILHILKKIDAKSQRLSDLQIHISDVKLQIYLENFEKIVEALLQNALELSFAGIKIEIVSGFLNRKYYLVVENEYQEDLDEEISNLKDYIEFNPMPCKQKKIGLKLAIVKKIVEIYKGKLELTIKPGRILNCSICLDLI